MGTTVSLSTYGAVIHGDVPVSDDVVVTISLRPSSGYLTGWGRIVRAEKDHSQAGVKFVIAVPRYRLERQSLAMARLDAPAQG